jgi:hypothetical protein
VGIAVVPAAIAVQASLFGIIPIEIAGRRRETTSALRWRLLIDTNEAVEFHRPISQDGGVVDVSGRSLALWELQPLKTFASDLDESSE